MTDTISINIRISKRRKSELQDVAKSLGMTLSVFLRQAALCEANRVIRNVRALPTSNQTEKP